MKKIILILFALIPILSFAQSGRDDYKSTTDWLKLPMLTEVTSGYKVLVRLDSDSVIYYTSLTSDNVTEGVTNLYNQTHTGEVTGSTGLTLAPIAISNKTLLSTPSGSEEMLVNDTGTLKKILISSISGGAASGASVTHSSNMLISSTSFIASFDTEQWDDNNYHDNSTNNSRLTVSSTGRYRITVICNLDFTLSISEFTYAIYLNGIRHKRFVPSEDGAWDQNDFYPITLSFVMSLTSGDYVEFGIEDISAGDARFPSSTDDRLLFQIEKL